MLVIKVQTDECFDEVTNEFVYTTFDLRLEHSLVSLSKWESKYEKPFLGEDKSSEELFYYIKCMTINEEVPDSVYMCMSDYNIQQINTYINAKMTATWFSELETEKPSREIITAELLYYMMIALNIPFECQHWHIKRLLTLIKVCNLKNTPKKKMNMKELAQRNRALNAQRRAQLKSSG